MVQLGDFAYQEKRFEDAFTWYKNAANQGIAKGQMRLAQLYQHGEGTDQDLELAAEWMKKAAKQGVIQAQYEYAYMLEFGKGAIRKDPKEAASWYMKAAENDYPDAMLRAAMLFQDGTGVEHDHYKALLWAIKAESANITKATTLKQQIIKEITEKADEGDVESQFALARIYKDGTGVEINSIASTFWLRKAAQRGHKEAQYHLGNLLAETNNDKEAIEWLEKASQQGHAQAGYSLAALLSKEELTNHAHKDAWVWLYHGAQNDDPKTLYNLATTLKLGKLGLPKSDYNYPKWVGKAAKAGVVAAQNDIALYFKLHNNDTRNSVVWLRSAAMAADAKAQFNLGLIYARGDGITPNDDHALHWWLEADKQGGTRTKVLLGLFHNLGRGVGRSEKQAAEWYRKAAEEGDDIATYNLAMLYYNGRGIDQNYELAAEYFGRLAHKGDPEAQNIYATLFLEGQGLKYSPEEASKWFQRAANAKNIYAMFNLATLYRGGTGVPQDDKKALYWYTKAANLNFAPAQNAVGYMYAQGRGTEVNKDTAEMWFQRASDNGLTIASQNAKALSKAEAFSLVRMRINTDIRDGILTDKEFDISDWLEPHMEAVL